MVDFYMVQPDSSEWHKAWAGLGAMPLNAGDKVSECPHTGEVWQYVGTCRDRHQFRHRNHPKTNRREVVEIVATASPCQCGNLAHATWCPDATLVWTVTEFWGDGDPMFGGRARDLSLGQDGAFGWNSWSTTATFATREAALAAGEVAPNRRAGGLLAAMSWSADPATGKRY